VATVRLNVEVKSDTSGALAATVKELENVDKAAQQANKSMKPLSDGFKETSSHVGEFADTVGRSATTLARSADAFGLPTQALRTLDDVMDVTELGFKNLSNAAAGFNAASVGVAGAGFAIGTMIGGLIRDLPGVAAGLDKLALSAANLLGWKTTDTGWDPAQLAKVKEAYTNVNATMAKSIDLLHQQGRSAKEIEEILKGKRAVTGEIKDPIQALLESYRKAEEAQKKQEEAAKKTAEEAKKAAEEQEKLNQYSIDISANMTEAWQAEQKFRETIEAVTGATAIQARVAEDMKDSFKSGMESTKKEVDAMAEKAQIAADKQIQALKDEDEWQKIVADGYKEIGAALQDLGSFVETLGGKFGDMFSSITKGIGGALSGIGNLKEAAKLGGGGIGGLFQKGMGTGFSFSKAIGSLGAIGSIASAGVGVVKTIVGFFKKDWTKIAQQAAQDIANAIAKGTSAASFIPNLLKDKKTAMETFASLSDQFAQMQEEYRNKIIENQQKGIAGIVTMVNNLGDAASVTQGSLDRMGTYTIAMFDTLRKQGVSFLDALKMIQPALDAIAAKAKESGKEMPKALADYQKFLDFGKANAGLFDTAQAQGDVISAMRHGGAIDVTNLKDLSKDVLGNVNAIRGGLGAKGMEDTKAHNMALAQNAEALFQLKKASEQYGIALDAQTQAEIDAAEAAGLFEGKEDPLDSMKASMDAMVQVLAAIAQAFGATLPDAVQKYIDTLNKIPTPPAPPGAPGGEAAPPGAPAPPPPGAPAPPPPHMAAGGLVSKPTYALIGEAGPEMVVPVGSARSSSSAAAVAAAIGASGKETSINLGNLHINQQPGEDPQALADRILQTVVQGVRYNHKGLRTELQYASEGR
jgi:hypothetical protein